MHPKLLVLESDWRVTPQSVPTERRSAARLYARVVGAQSVWQRPLCGETLVAELRAFLNLPGNRRGPNLIILSSHAYYRHTVEQPIIAGINGAFALDAALQPLAGQLRRSVLMLDACYLGLAVPALCQQTQALACLGFARVVDWTASSVFVLSLLRHWQAAGVFAMRRCSATRPRRVLEQMARGEYAGLMTELGLCYAFAPGYVSAG